MLFHIVSLSSGSRQLFKDNIAHWYELQNTPASHEGHSSVCLSVRSVLSTEPSSYIAVCRKLANPTLFFLHLISLILYTVKTQTRNGRSMEFIRGFVQCCCCSPVLSIMLPFRSNGGIQTPKRLILLSLFDC